MKSATIVFSLSKDQQVVKHNITPVEAMIMVSMHHKNVGGSPVAVVKGTEKDIFVSDADGKQVLNKDGKPIPFPIDDELARLRRKYHPDKVDAMASKVREFPVDDFDKAVKMAVGITLPDNRLSTTEIK